MKAKSALLIALVLGSAAALGACGTESSTPQAATSTESASTSIAGSGSGLCFDRNSALAQSAMTQLAAPPIGNWKISSASEDQLAAGCDGVLSWMAVSSDVNHPHTHILFFTDGTYLGTATPKPYTNTQVTDLDRTAVSVKYHWLQNGDPMCCPSGGPRVATFTLNGTTVQSTGEFPPDN